MTGHILILAAAVALSSLPARAQTVDEIVARSLAARGGVKTIRETQSQRLTGRISFDPDSGGPLIVELKRPGKMRTEITMQGKNMIQTTDGKSGWSVNPLAGSEEPRPLSADEMRNLAGGADFEGPLLDYLAKGNKIELAGKHQVEGKDAWKLKVTLKDGQIRYDYIDCANHLEVKWEGSILQDGKEVGVESFFRDYRKVNGLMVAFVIDSDTPGTPYKQHIIFDKVEVNPPEDDGRFGKPATSPAAAQSH